MARTTRRTSDGSVSMTNRASGQTTGSFFVSERTERSHRSTYASKESIDFISTAVFVAERNAAAGDIDCCRAADRRISRCVATGVNFIQSIRRHPILQRKRAAVSPTATERRREQKEREREALSGRN